MVCLFWFVAGAGLVANRSIQGQGIFRPIQQTQSGRFIEPPRSVQQELREAERALSEERYSDAVVRLGDLLAAERNEVEAGEFSGQDFFLEIDESRSAGRPVRKSLLRAAREMIGKLPTAAMETYELRYGPLARKELREASVSRDWDAIGEVRRKYFHTLAGYEASCLLSQREMFSGHPLAASLYLDDVVVQPRALKHLGDEALLLNASARLLCDRPLPEFQNFTAGRSARIDGKTIDWPTAAELEAWLRERFGALEDYSAPGMKDYAMFGATVNRNGPNDGQLPLSNERWMLDTTSSPIQKRSIRNKAEELTAAGKMPPPSWVPLRVGDQLLMRTTERLVGVDHRTGKRVWTYPWQSGYELFEEEEASVEELPGDDEASDLLTQRVWNDVPYGQITSDGERVYILDGLREVEMASFNPMMNLRGIRPADTRHNTLVALELASEGKLRWRLGAGADEASSLSDGFFLGPPLPLDGRLYVLVELAGDINLCCLDSVSGQELWRQQLVAIESGGVESDPIRRVAGAMPTYHEGILICPTGAGAIVAIDLVDRMFRWGVSFDRNTEMIRSVAGRGRGPETDQLMQRWSNSAAIASNTAVLLTSIEADRLFGFELLTGESLFSEKTRVHMKYLAGIRDGKFFVAGSNQLRAFDLKTGASVWTTPRDMLSPGQQIAGYGVFGKDEYLIPTTANEIVRISLADGSVIDRRSTGYPLGNLVAVDGEVISQGPTTLSVAFGEATLEPKVNEILKKNPNDFEAMVRKAELLIQHGELSEALDLLAKTRQIEPDNDEVRMLSVSAMLGELRESSEIDPELVSTLDKLIDQPSQRLDLLALQVRAGMESGARLDAAARLIDLSRLLVSESLLDDSAKSLIRDPVRQCMLNDWLAARAAQLAEDSSPDELEQIDLLLREEVVSRKQASTRVLQQMLGHFRVFNGVAPLREELAKRMIEDGAFLELERLALGNRVPNETTLQEISNERLWMLAESYSASRMYKDLIRVLDQLQVRQNEPYQAERLVELRQIAEKELEIFQWPKRVTTTWVAPNGRIDRTMQSNQRVAETSVLAGRQFNGWRLVSEATSPLGLRDPLGVLRRIPLESNVMDMDKEAQICGGVMVVVMPDGLTAINLLDLLNDDGDGVLWSRKMSADGGPIARRRSAITPFDDQVVRYYIASNITSNVIPEFRLGPITGDRVLILQGGELSAIDLLTKDTLWRNSSAPLSGAVLSDGQRVAVVSPATEEVVFFSLLDGRKLGVDEWRGGEIWEALGTNVLSYRETETPGQYDVALTNPFEKKEILKHRTVGATRPSEDDSIEATYGRVVGGRFLTLLHNDGKTLVWDLAEGREIANVALPAYPSLIGLNAILLENSLVLLPKIKVDPTELPDAPQLQTSDGKFHVTVNAAHAISLVDGSIQWGHQFERAWGCTLTQPAETPLLVFSRSPFTYSTTSRRKKLDVMAINVRDGLVVDKSEGRDIVAGNNKLETMITVKPTLSRILIRMGPQQLTYTFDPESIENSEPAGKSDVAEKLGQPSGGIEQKNPGEAGSRESEPGEKPKNESNAEQREEPETVE